MKESLFPKCVNNKPHQRIYILSENGILLMAKLIVRLRNSVSFPFLPSKKLIFCRLPLLFSFRLPSLHPLLFMIILLLSLSFIIVFVRKISFLSTQQLCPKNTRIFRDFRYYREPGTCPLQYPNMFSYQRVIGLSAFVWFGLVMVSIPCSSFRIFNSLKG